MPFPILFRLYHFYFILIPLKIQTIYLVSSRKLCSKDFKGVSLVFVACPSLNFHFSANRAVSSANSPRRNKRYLLLLNKFPMQPPLVAYASTDPTMTTATSIR